MKKILIALFLMMPLMAWAEKPNPADYTLNVHVQSSRLVLDCGVINGGSVCGWDQYLTVLINGRKYELEGPTTSKKIHLLPNPAVVLHTGDYKAKVLKASNDKTYEYSMSYEFLFPDGDTRTYIVVAESE